MSKEQKTALPISKIINIADNKADGLQVRKLLGPNQLYFKLKRNICLFPSIYYYPMMPWIGTLIASKNGKATYKIDRFEQTKSQGDSSIYSYNYANKTIEDKQTKIIEIANKVYLKDCDFLEEPDFYNDDKILIQFCRISFVYENYENEVSKKWSYKGSDTFYVANCKQISSFDNTDGYFLKIKNFVLVISRDDIFVDVDNMAEISQVTKNSNKKCEIFGERAKENALIRFAAIYKMLEDTKEYSKYTHEQIAVRMRETIEKHGRQAGNSTLRNWISESLKTL